MFATICLPQQTLLGGPSPKYFPPTLTKRKGEGSDAFGFVRENPSDIPGLDVRNNGHTMRAFKGQITCEQPSCEVPGSV